MYTSPLLISHAMRTTLHPTTSSIQPSCSAPATQTGPSGPSSCTHHPHSFPSRPDIPQQTCHSTPTLPSPSMFNSPTTTQVLCNSNLQSLQAQQTNHAC